MSNSNVTLIGTARMPSPALAIRVEKLRQRLLTEAMPFVETTRMALHQDHQLNEREVLRHAFRILNKVAEDLGEISGCPTMDDEEEDAP